MRQRATCLECRVNGDVGCAWSIVTLAIYGDENSSIVSLQISTWIGHGSGRPAPNQPVLVDLSDSRYSVRNTRIGSVRVARIAGIYIAISETAASRIAEIPNTVESNR
jgi:hypothetical protein